MGLEPTGLAGVLAATAVLDAAQIVYPAEVAALVVILVMAAEAVSTIHHRSAVVATVWVALVAVDPTALTASVAVVAVELVYSAKARRAVAIPLELVVEAAKGLVAGLVAVAIPTPAGMVVIMVLAVEGTVLVMRLLAAVAVAQFVSSGALVAHSQVTLHNKNGMTF